MLHTYIYMYMWLKITDCGGSKFCLSVYVAVTAYKCYKFLKQAITILSKNTIQLKGHCCWVFISSSGFQRISCLAFHLLDMDSVLAVLWPLLDANVVMLSKESKLHGNWFMHIFGWEMRTTIHKLPWVFPLLCLFTISGVIYYKIKTSIFFCLFT